MRRLILLVSLVAAAFDLGSLVAPADVAARSVAGVSVRGGGALPPLPRQIADRKRWVIGVKCDYPPFGYVDVRAAKVGFDVAIARRFAKLAFGDENRVDLVCVNTASREPTLRSGQVDMLIATYAWTLARAQQFDFSLPYYAAPGRVAVPTSSPVKSLADLAGKRIVTTRGSIYAGWIGNCRSTSTLVEADGVSAALATVKEGRAEGFLWDESVLLSVVATDPALRLTQDSMVSVPWGIAVRKGESATLGWINAAIRQMTRGDEFYALLSRYLPPNVSVGDVPRPGRPELKYIGSSDPRTNCSVITLPPRATAAARPKAVKPPQPKQPKSRPVSATPSVRPSSPCRVCGFEATFVFKVLPPKGSKVTLAWYYNREYQGQISKKLTRRVSSFIKWAGPAPRGFYWCDLIVTEPGKLPVTVARALIRR